ncbi:MAG: hypothetical protein WB870_02590 [Gallionellaceae bacterium]
MATVSYAANNLARLNSPNDTLLSFDSLQSNVQHSLYHQQRSTLFQQCLKLINRRRFAEQIALERIASAQLKKFLLTLVSTPSAITANPKV